MSKFIKEDKYFIFDNEIKNGIKFKLRKVKNKLKSIIYKTLMNLSAPKRKIEAKYNVSICAIFKNEALYLKEWIEFHRIVGIEHFYMYNNNSEDNFREISFSSGQVSALLQEQPHIFIFLFCHIF